MTRLTKEQVRAIRDLTSAWPDHKLVLVGASALGCSFDMQWRQTHDLDVSVAVSVDDHQLPLRSLPGWTKDPKQEHRWISPAGVSTDIVPAGPREMLAGKIIWPGTKAEMSLTGFRLAFERAADVAVGGDVSVKAAPPEVVVLLKMVAYQDRPQERERDLEDIGYVLDRLIPPDAEERFSDEIIAQGLTYEMVSPWIVGRWISQLVNAVERQAVLAFLEKVENEDDPDQTQARMARVGPWRGDAQAMLLQIKAFRQGFSQRGE